MSLFRTFCRITVSDQSIPAATYPLAESVLRRCQTSTVREGSGRKELGHDHGRAVRNERELWARQRKIESLAEIRAKAA